MDQGRLKEIYRALEKVTRAEARAAKAEEQARQARDDLGQLLMGAQTDLVALGKAVGVTLGETQAVPKLAKAVRRPRAPEPGQPEWIEVDDKAIERADKRACQLLRAKGFVEKPK